MADIPGTGGTGKALDEVNSKLTQAAQTAKELEKSVEGTDKHFENIAKSVDRISSGAGGATPKGPGNTGAAAGTGASTSGGAITIPSTGLATTGAGGAPVAAPAAVTAAVTPAFQQPGQAPAAPGVAAPPTTGLAPAPNASQNAAQITTPSAAAAAPTGGVAPGATASAAAAAAASATSAPTASQAAQPGRGGPTITPAGGVPPVVFSNAPAAAPPSAPPPTIPTAPGAPPPSGGGGGGVPPVVFSAAAAGGAGAGGGGGGGGGIYGLTPNQTGGNAPIGMIGTGVEAGGGGGGGGGVMGAIYGGAKFLGGMALAGISDLRFGREEALRYEQSRLISMGGTGDFQRFAGNMERAMNKINVTNRQVFERGLATAYGSYYAQGFGGPTRANLGGPSGQVFGGGGGIFGSGNPFNFGARLTENAMGVYNRQPQYGEVRTAQTFGAMSTLASISGLKQEAVTGGLESMYSPQSYYRAMAAGIMTREPTTGNMMTTEEIVNQYRGRFKNQTPDQIRRALAPGGALAAELKQTWQNPELEKMISQGIIMTATTGKPIEAGKIEEAARAAGYAGLRSTQGRDSEMRRLAAEEGRLGAYVDDITAGIKTANNLVASLNDWLTNLGSVGHRVIGGLETMGGLLDTFNTTMPQSTQKMVDALTSVTSKLLGLVGGEFFQDIITAGLGMSGASEGDWFVSKNQPMNVHQGEMILPARLATAVRQELSIGRTTVDSPVHTTGLKAGRGSKGSEAAAVNIYLTVQNASDAQATNFARRVKKIIENDNELIGVGTGEYG